jgi:signal transduction histidine kinase
MTKSDHLILYVDDERGNRVVFEHTFAEKFHVKVVASAEEALELFKKESVSVLVTDQRMPDMSGNDLLVRVKELYPEVIRIVITAYSDLDPLLSAVNEGLVARYLVKPWDRLELERILHWAVQAHALGLQSSALQLRLIETERLVTLGTISAAVVHDLIQPLTHMTYNADFLASNAQLAKDLAELVRKNAKKLGLTEPELHAEFLEELLQVAQDLREGCAYLTGTVSRLRPFMGAARAETGTVETDPLAVIQYAMNVCRVVAHEADADFLYDGPNELPKVAMDTTELTQTMINLLTNSAQSLREADRPSSRVLVRAIDLGSVLRIIVADNGVGMSDEVLAKLGTPFFSTRPNGTGLGIMQCRRFIEKVGGKLSFQSKPGDGTTVTIEIPRAPVPGTRPSASGT